MQKSRREEMEACWVSSKHRTSEYASEHCKKKEGEETDMSTICRRSYGQRQMVAGARLKTSPLLAIDNFAGRGIQSVIDEKGKPTSNMAITCNEDHYVQMQPALRKEH